MASKSQVDLELNRIRLLRTERKYPEAYNALKELIIIHPENRVAKLLLVEIAMALKLWAEAEAICRELYSSSSNNEQKLAANLKLVRVLRMQEQTIKARAVLKEILAEDPDNHKARVELGNIFILENKRRQKGSKYWARRQKMVYLFVVEQIAKSIGQNANAIIDIGSNATPILDWFPEVPHKYSLDPGRPYEAADVVSIKEDFLKWNCEERIDLGLCLQVLEHVKFPQHFAERLMTLCEIAVVSVPYKWPADKTKYHRHDPIDLEKIVKWFGRNPNYQYIAQEINGEQRIILVYDRTKEDEWGNINEAKFMFRWSLRGSGL